MAGNVVIFVKFCNKYVFLDLTDIPIERLTQRRSLRLWNVFGWRTVEHQVNDAGGKSTKSLVESFASGLDQTN